MEPYCKDDGLFYMGAQTKWLPAEHFMDINNWDDSLKPSAAHYIKQVEEWIASNGEGDELARGGVTQDISHTMSTQLNVVVNEEQEVIITKPTSNEDVGSNDLTFYSFTV